jgi:hypothetical protein
MALELRTFSPFLGLIASFSAWETHRRWELGPPDHDSDCSVSFSLKELHLLYREAASPLMRYYGKLRHRRSYAAAKQKVTPPRKLRCRKAGVTASERRYRE